MAEEDPRQARDAVTDALVQAQAEGRPIDARERLRLDPLLYEELRKMAGKLMQGERAAHTLQPTALVNEAWMRLADSERVAEASRPAFLGLVARTMRRVLVDHGRARATDKRGGGWRRVTMSGEGEQETSFDLLDLDEALAELAEHSERRALIVEMRFFAGMSVADVAQALGLSDSSVRLDWYAARAWLGTRLQQ